MKTKLTEFPKIAKSGAAFFLCYLAGFGASYLLDFFRFRWPDSRFFVFFLNQLFFYPQTALPQSFSTVGSNNREVLSSPAAMIVSVLFWVIVGCAFAWLTRRLRLYFTVPLAVISIFVVLLAVELVLGLFGLQIVIRAT